MGKSFFLFHEIYLYLSKKLKQSFVYILSNKNNTVFYVGVTSNLLKRIEEHKNGLGSKFTQKYNITELKYFETFSDINQAIEREKSLKNWHRDWKLNLIKEFNPKLKDLYYEL